MCRGVHANPHASVSGGLRMIPHSRPLFDAAGRDAVMRVLDSGQVVMGDEVRELERRVASLVQQPAAVAVDSGTSALMLALRALDARTGIRRVGLPAYCCSSVGYAVRAAGMQPVWMDCDANLRLQPEAARRQAESLDAVVLVHPFGMLEPLVVEEWPCPVIEDIATAAGACMQGQPAGSFGDVCIVSLRATKPWGGVFGGMVASRDETLLQEIKTMRTADHQHRWPAYAGAHQLSEIHAALALRRLERAEAEMICRREAAKRLDGWLDGTATRPVPRDGNHFRYIVRTSSPAAEVIDGLRRMGVEAAHPVGGFSPDMEPLAERFPGAWEAWKDCVSLPLLADFSEAEWQIMHKAVRSCLG